MICMFRGWVKMKLLKVWGAKFLKNRMAFPNTKAKADKWNHLSAIISSKGNVRIDWNKITETPVIKCSRCIKVIRKGIGKKELCDGCKKIQKKKR